ncbi:MAG: tetratricopeptide repeat protein [Nitrospirae bacterium]|nr:tetratricopeptide repeat protein [Nitrospirota bacterium]MBF0541813.1 tetratricopeptide repeat protein [Nitrospirota bacterium]
MRERKNNMKTKTMYALFFSILLFSCAKHEWIEFTSTDGAFSIMMPGKPSEKTEPINTVLGQIDQHTFYFRRNAEFVVGYIDLPEIGMKHSTSKQIFDDGQNGAVKSTNSKILDETSISLDDNPGREVKMESQDGKINVRMRMYLIKNRFYTVLNAYAKNDTSVGTYIKFFDSFKVKNGSKTEEPVKQVINKPEIDLPNQTASVPVNTQPDKEVKINSTIVQKPINDTKPPITMQKESVPEQKEPISIPQQDTNTVPKHTFSANDYFSKGLSYVVSGNYKQALEEFNNAIENNPKLAIAYYNRGIVYSRLGDNNGAIKDFKMAASLGDKFAKDYLKMQDSSFADNQPEQVNTRSQQINTLSVQKVVDLYSQGLSYFKKNNYIEAIKYFNTAIEADPQYVDAYVGRGAAYDKVNNHEQAIEDIKTAASLGHKGSQDWLSRHGLSW